MKGSYIKCSLQMREQEGADAIPRLGLERFEGCTEEAVRWEKTEVVSLDQSLDRDRAKASWRLPF